MVNRSPGEDNAVSSESFEAWLDQAAESKGVSKQDLINQMLSSYWILDELTGLVGETNRFKDERATEPIDSERTGKVETAERSTTNVSETEAGSTEERIETMQAAIRELVESQPEHAETESDEKVTAEPASNQFDGSFIAMLSELQRQVGRFESELETLDERQDTQLDRLSDELQLLLDRVTEMEDEQSQFAHERDVETIADDVRDLGSRTKELRTQNRDLEAQIDHEFDSIEELFGRMLREIDELDSKINATDELYQSELKPIKQRKTERERLEEFKNEALRQEVRRGSCESCGLGIDLAMLESRSCPKCDAQFSGIDDSGWNPFRPPTLKTAPIDET